MAKRRLERSLRVTFLGLLVNAALAAGKIAAGVIGHSQALVADGVESAADFVSSLIVWRGVTVAAAVVATVLIFAAVAIVIGAIRDIVTPHRVPEPFTLAVLVAVVLIKEILFRIVQREGLELESTVVSADAWHHRSDAITSLFA